jgi:hypothetical protein
LLWGAGHSQDTRDSGDQNQAQHRVSPEKWTENVEPQARPPRPGGNHTSLTVRAHPVLSVTEFTCLPAHNAPEASPESRVMYFTRACFYAAVCAYLMPVSVLVAGLNYANAKR